MVTVSSTSSNPAGMTNVLADYLKNEGYDNDALIEKLKFFVAENNKDNMADHYFEVWTQLEIINQFIELVRDRRTIQNGEGACERPAAELH